MGFIQAFLVMLIDFKDCETKLIDNTLVESKELGCLYISTEWFVD